ncbi:MAG: hypothetical protein HY926_02340, partial [Elusimicrobia bacterium]|nr:hypothetical protein [Elusimicrobiota bacterium]
MATVEDRIENQLPSQPQEPGAPGEVEISMEALLASQDELQQKLSGKQVAWVKVISTTRDCVLVDVGEKNEGAIPVSEFDGEGDAGERKLPAAGQRIPVLRAGPGRKDGHTVLSYKRARAELGWAAALKTFQEKGRVRGRVTAAIKGGYLVNVSGVTAFLPASLADLHPVRVPARMVNTGVRCYIIEVNESKRQLVLSR